MDDVSCWLIGKPCAETTLACESYSTVQANLDDIKSKVSRELDIYAGYPAGWDGYDGVIFSEPLVRRMCGTAIRFLDQFEAARESPSLVEPGPASDGSLDLCLAFGPRSLQLTMYPDAEDVLVYWKSGNERREITARSSAISFSSWVSWLLGESGVSAPMEGSRGDS